MDNKRIVRITVIVAAVLFVFLGVAGMKAVKAKNTAPALDVSALADLVDSEPVIDVRAYDMKIRALGELTTGELTYDGLVDFEKGNIPLLTKHSFLMTYSSTVRAGIDFSQVSIREAGGRWVITVPYAEIQTITIDPDSLAFYDTKNALFNGDEKEDVSEALVAAEQNVQEMADLDKLCRVADEQVEVMIYQLLGDVVDHKEIRVERR